MELKKVWIGLLCILMVLVFCACGKEEEQTGLESSDVIAEETANVASASEVIAVTGDYFLNMSSQLSAGSDDWVILALARSGEEMPEGLFDNYYVQLEQLLTEKNGVLDENKVTEYFRVAVTVSAIGKDPQNVVGYN